MRWSVGLTFALVVGAAVAQPTLQTTVNILETKVLNILEDTGFSLSESLGGNKNALTAEMYKSNQLYRSFADTINRPLSHDIKTDQLPQIIPPGSGDIPELVRLIRNFEDKGRRSGKDLKGGYFIRHLSNNSQHPYTVEYDGDEPRHFDARWLNSKFGAMKLIAVVNRMDRMDFQSTNCGEVRFVYRLSYRTSKSSSTLPFFLNIVKAYPKRDDCTIFARRWQLATNLSPAQKATELRDGPLKDLTFKQMEMNFQSLRFTSGYMHDFGGQAMYIQRIFRAKGGKLEPVALENTPDVLAVEHNPALLADFVAYLKQGDHLDRLDRGTLVINFNPRFLTKFSVSWSTLGRARTANKPYSRLFQNRRALLESIDISRLKYLKSHDALVERLNNLTCMGCHQSGGTAGFHMLGYADDKFSHGFNKQQQALSPHAAAEQARRLTYVESLAAGRLPNTFRPHSNFPEAVWPVAGGVQYKPATVGQLCVAANDFAESPGCAPINGQPTTCQRTVTSKTQPVLFGECVVKGGHASAGAVCWKGEVAEVATLRQDRGPIPAYNLFAFQDKWKFGGSAYTGAEVQGLRCVLPQSGAPLGRASRACTLEEENFTGLDDVRKIPPQLCANQGGNGFDLCAAASNSGACLESRVVRGMLDTCTPSRSCREDYICQKFPEYDKISDASYGSRKAGKRVNRSTPDRINGQAIRDLHQAEAGFCVPTYFLFNMRLDGHPSPATGEPPGQPRIDHTQPVRGYR